MSPDITLLSLTLIFSFFIPILVINHLLKIKINRELIVSALRMVIQLLFVGVYLQFIFQLNNPFINLLYIFVMIIIASIHSIKSSSLNLGKLFFPMLVSVSLPQLVVLLSFDFLFAGRENLFDAKFIIPVGGMLLGNCISGNIIALNTFYNGIRDDEKRYNYVLTLGASHNQALLPYLRKSIILSTKPTLASLATIGLVSLPGMMTGQILAGALPFKAIKYQIAIMVSIFSAKYFSILLSLIFTKKRGFNKYHILDREIFYSNEKKKRDSHTEK